MIQTGLVERAPSGVAWPPPTSNSTPPPQKASNSDRQTHNHLKRNTEWHHDQLTPRVVVCKRRVGPTYTVYHKIKDVQSIKKQSASQFLGTVFAMTSGYDKWLWQVAMTSVYVLWSWDITTPTSTPPWHSSAAKTIHCPPALCQWCIMWPASSPLHLSNKKQAWELPEVTVLKLGGAWGTRHWKMLWTD